MTRAFAFLAASILSASVACGALAQFVTADPSMLSTTGADLAPLGGQLQPAQPAPPYGRAAQQLAMYQQQEAQQFQALLKQQAMHPGAVRSTQSLDALRQQQDQYVQPSPEQLQARAQLEALFQQGIRTTQQRQQAEQLFARGQWNPNAAAQQRQQQLQAAQQRLPIVQQQLKAKQDEVPRVEKARDQQKAQLVAQKQQDIAALMRRLDEQRSRQGQGPADSANASAALVSDLSAAYDQRLQALEAQYAQLLAALKGEIGELQQQAAELQQRIQALQAG